IINVHHFSEQIIDFVKTNDFGVHIMISDESEQLLNTGGGLLKAKHFFENSTAFFVFNVDVISSINLAQMYEMHMARNAVATLAVSQRTTSRYLLFDKNHQLCGWENRSVHERIVTRVANDEELQARAFSGIQILSPHIFDYITETGAFSIIDMYVRLAKNQNIQAFDHTNDFWIDVGKFDTLQEITQLLKTQKFDFLA
ncbi:MAG: nucleotidyltransferase family protein, partial [Bacteroidales bacterium]|nr:nucleotidyltransferase family protein [Bacteroidales bacterium]